MAAEHLTVEETDAYQRRTLPPRDLLRISDHLIECADCRERVRQLVAPDSLGEIDLTYEDLAGYLDDELPAERRALVTQKLRDSPAVAAELADLARFRAEMNALPPTAYGELTFTGKIIGFPRALARWALPLAALFLLGVGGLWWFGRSASNDGLVTLQDHGQRILIAKNGRSELLQGLPIGLRVAVINAAEKGELEIPASVKSLGGQRRPLAGGPGAAAGFSLVRPIATAVRNNGTVFQWTPRAGASRYRVLVASTQTGEVVASETTKDAKTSWQPEAPLVAGQSYQWEVEALRGEEVLERAPRPPLPEARFTVLSEESQREFEQVAKAHGGSHLVVAIAAARAGLLIEAEKELRALAQENPTSKLPEDLLAQLRH